MCGEGQAPSPGSRTDLSCLFQLLMALKSSVLSDLWQLS